MEVKYDDLDIKLSSKTVTHLKLFMKHFIKDMRKQDEFDKSCWVWGVCEITDLANKNPVFSYGGLEDLPTEEELKKGNKIFIRIDDNGTFKYEE